MVKLEATPRFELGIAALQAAALPLGDVAKITFNSSDINQWCPGPDLNRHDRNDRGILSPLCLPIPPPGQIGTKTKDSILNNLYWSEKGGSNSRPQPWQGYALPLSYSRILHCCDQYV